MSEAFYAPRIYQLTTSDLPNTHLINTKIYVFSDPSAPEIKTPDFEQSEITYNMTENVSTITREDISSAISEVKKYSAAGPDELIAILPKRCTESILEPI